PPPAEESVMRVIVLNNDYSYINRVSVHKAIRMIEKGKVTVEKWSERTIRTVKRSFFIPLVVRLIKFVRIIYGRKVQWKPRNVFIRDNYTCVYCGRENLSGAELTVDHVLPRFRGGRDTFENTVTACKACNNKKGGRTPTEAVIYFHQRGFTPYQPTIMEFMTRTLEQQGVSAVLRTLGVY
ncbi:MAG: HNH endonuclease, partial [Thermodesulfobacteriota bacterium]